MRGVYLKALHSEAQQHLGELFERVEFPRWNAERWKDSKGRRRVTHEVRISVKLKGDAKFVDREDARVVRALGNYFDLWYTGAHMAGSGICKPGWTKLAFIKKVKNQLYQTHETGRAGGGTLHFNGVFDHWPTIHGLRKAQGDAGYDFIGYGGPGNVKVERREDSMYMVSCVCSGSCE